MRWRTRLCLATCGLLIATTALAQGFRGLGQGGPPRPGFGGPGGDSIGSVMLIGIPEVQHELKLSDEQKTRIADVIGKIQEQSRTVFGGFNFQEAFTLEESERDKRFAKMRTQMEGITKQAEEQLAKILDKSQASRFSELQLQRGGVGSLLREEIGKQLKLSEAQRDKIRKLIEQNPPFFAPPEQRKKAEADVVAVLDPMQQGQWEKLKGADFAFPEPNFGFGPPGGPGAFGPPGGGGPGGPVGPMPGNRKLVKQFDKDEDGRLNKEERQAARDSMKSEAGRRGGFGPPGGPGGRGPFGPRSEPGKPGPRVSPDDVSPSDAPLYDPQVLRTIFIDFEDNDWEAELADFNNTDVEVPATLTVDGQKYPNVGVHFRGMSSFMAVPVGSKRSLNLSLDFVDSTQRLLGYKTLNLLNAHEDDSFLSSVLYSHIARQHIPAPKANFMKVVINGESWGVYANLQQFNKEYLAENFPSAKGTRWKVSGSPGGGGGLEYLGDNVEDYRRRYDMKSGDDNKAWKRIIKLCKTLNETPADELEAALEPLVDIDGLLWFLALDNALINCDGYWIRASDYSIFLDAKGKFHFLPHDMNEAFRAPMGPGPGGPGGARGGPPGRGGFGGRPGEGRPDGPRGEERSPEERRPNGDRPNDPRPGDNARPGGLAFDLDPLIGLDDARKPLRSKVLAVPSLRTRYLQHVRTIAEESLDWKNLGPVVAQYRSLIEKEIEADTRKLGSFADFQKATADVAAKESNDKPDAEPTRRFGPPRHSVSLRAFADQRREFLLKHPAVKSAIAK